MNKIKKPARALAMAVVAKLGLIMEEYGRAEKFCEEALDTIVNISDVHRVFAKMHIKMGDA